MCADDFAIGIAEVRDGDRRYVNPNAADTAYNVAIGKSSRRKHPIRRLRVGWESLWLRVGEWLLHTFPFLRPPAEWAVRQLDRLARWWGL